MYSTLRNGLIAAILSVCVWGQPVLVDAAVVSPDFVSLAKRLNPTVVNIRTARLVKQGQAAPHQQMPPGAEPFN